MAPKPDSIDVLVKQISDLLPEDLRQTKQDLEKNLRAALRAALQRMDLVTREEFDIQQQLLANTRDLLQQMEKKIEQLETGLNTSKERPGR